MWPCLGRSSGGCSLCFSHSWQTEQSTPHRGMEGEREKEFRERKEPPLAQRCMVGVHHLHRAAKRCSTACCLPRACPWDFILAGSLGRYIFHSELLIRSKLEKQASLVMLSILAFVHAIRRPYEPRELSGKTTIEAPNCQTNFYLGSVCT